MDDHSAARSRLIPPLPWSTFSPPFSTAGIGPGYQSLQEDGEAGKRPLVRQFEPIAYWGTLALAIALGLAALARRNQPIVLRIPLIAAAGLVVNAAVFGGLSAPSARYQSRII